MEQEARQEYRMGMVVSGLASTIISFVLLLCSVGVVRDREREIDRDRGLWALYTRLRLGDFTL